MPDLHLAGVRNICILGLMVVNLIIGFQLIRVGLKARPFFLWRGWDRRYEPHISGRLVLGMFFLLIAFREFDIVFNRWRYPGSLRVLQETTDLDSVLPLVVGVYVFGVWSAIRFVRGDIGDRDNQKRERGA